MGLPAQRLTDLDAYPAYPAKIIASQPVLWRERFPRRTAMTRRLDCVPGDQDSAPRIGPKQQLFRLLRRRC